MIGKVGFFLFLSLNLRSYGAGSDPHLEPIPRRTIASITEEMRGEFKRLLEKREAVGKVEEQFPALKEEMMQLQQSLVGQFERLRIETVFHYQAATGIFRNRQMGAVLVDEEFHLKLVRFYKKSLKILKTKGREEMIPLVEQYIVYYGGLCDIYAEDETHFLVVKKKRGGTEIHLKNDHLVFLTTLLEEHQDVLEAIKFLEQFPLLPNLDPGKYPSSNPVYESYALKNPPSLMQGALDMREFLKACEP